MTITQEPAVRSKQAKPWWKRPWVAPLGFVVAVFLVYSLPPYLGLDVAESRVPPPPGVGWYYPMLVTHIGFASIAMVTCALQIWPWLRQRHPVAHRRIGRVYVFGGVLPAGVAAVIIASAMPVGPVAAVSNTIFALLWLFFTVKGYRAARARRFGDHRRWMIRSFALTMSIITNRLWAPIWGMVLAPQLETTFGGSEAALGFTIAGITTWIGWTLPLLIAEFWLTERGKGRKRVRTPAAN
ncbi:DUF2306 domain-containing protein [Amycolatopsis sp. NPDC058986]|uniref:DUF2306 domain-containing protein n=1 Tax=unclassified Amycolatopsis TaxID=2618356 RepID=UPI00366A9BDC